jgi:DNA-binding transcriptional LysR family regulator
MDIDRLRYFTVVAQTGSLTAASEILHVSPPALSKAMAVLESEVGTKLFQRVGRGIELTEEGRSVLPRAQIALHSVDDIRVTKGATVNPRIRIGSFEVFSTYFLGPMMRDKFADHELELYDLRPGDLERSLVDNRIDIGITYLPIPNGSLDFMKVGNIQMAIYGRPALKGKDLKNLPFAVPIQPVQGAPTKINGLDGWPDNRIPRYQKYKVTLMESAMELCRQGLCVAYLPSFIVALHNKRVMESSHLVEISAPGSPKVRQDVFLIQRKPAKENETIRKISRLIRMY